MKNVGFAVAVIAAAIVTASALGASANLPGGTQISVSIATPATGTVPAAPISLTGTSAVGAAAPVANTLLLFVVDVSGSTTSPVPGALCGNANPLGDALSGTTLDCELAAVSAIRAQAILEGTVGQIGLVVFGGQQSNAYHPNDAAAADLDPAGTDTPLTGPNSPNFATPLQSVFASGGIHRYSEKFTGGFTNYYAAVEKALAVADTSSMTNKIVVMLSDGIATAGGPTGHLSATTLLPPAAATHHVTFQTFAIGSAVTAPCNNLGSGSQYGNLTQIATLTGGTCHQVTDPADAATIVPDAIASKLLALQTTVDGVPAGAPATTPLALPQNGPVSVGFSQTIPTLSEGGHDICVLATGSDAGGGDSVQDCKHVTVKEPPTIDGLPPDGPDGTIGSVHEGTAFPLTATAGGATTTSWASAPMPGAEGSCSFAPDSSASTLVTCTDDGVYALTLTATDEVGQTASRTVHLAVTNVAPLATLILPPGPHPLAQTLAAHAAISDPGADTWTCVFAWGDGATDTVAATGNACDASHAYGSGGDFVVGVTVADDDSGLGDDSQPLRIDAPPSASAGADVSGLEGSLLHLNGSTADDFGPLTSSWTAAPGLGVDAGATCTFGNTSSPTTTIQCTDDGDWVLTLTASDGLNPAATSSLRLHLGNVAPSLALSDTVSGLQVTVTGQVADAGTNDTQTCSFAWGDSTPNTIGVTVSGGMCQATHTYATGTHNASITVSATDDDGGSASSTLNVTLNRPPSCTSVASSVTELWPPNHALQLVVLGGATDPDGDPLAYAITSVRQDEPTNGLGDGDTAVDAVNAGPGMVRLRAERAGGGDGRVYTIAFTVSDGKGGSCAGSVEVTVPKSASKPAVLTPGPGYDSFH